jgi:replicative DNA helicase
VNDAGEITELELRSDASEKALLGAVAYEPDALAGVLAALPGTDFYDPHRGAVWDACRALSAERRAIDPTSVARQLAAHSALTTSTRAVVGRELLNAAPAAHAARHADAVADLARRRELLRAIARARSAAAHHPGTASDALTAARAELDAVAGPQQEHDAPLPWSELIDEFERAHAPGGSRPGIPSPWWELDQVLGGLFGGRVYVFGGRPGVGKSTAALNIAMHAAAESRKQVLVISREMPTLDVTGRLLGAGAEVPLPGINSRSVSDVGRARIRDYVKRVGAPPISVDARPRSLAGIRALARRRHHRRGLDVLVVDYVQLVRTDTPARSREQEVAEVSRQLKELALELDCVVVLPAQLNRESGKRADPRPTMSDLRDSGQLEQDADAVVLLHQPRTDAGDPTGQILMIVDKNRHGPRAEVSLRWHGGYGSIG